MKNFTLFLCLLILPGILAAQWNPVDLGTGETSNKLYAFNNDTAIVIGNDTTLIRTDDGGATWNKMNFTLPLPIEYHFMDIDFIDNNTGFIVTTKTRDASSVYQNGIMLKTTDKGSNWSEVGLSVFSDGSGDTITDPLVGKKVSFTAVRFSGNTGYAAISADWPDMRGSCALGRFSRTSGEQGKTG